MLPSSRYLSYMFLCSYLYALRYKLINGIVSMQRLCILCILLKKCHLARTYRPEVRHVLLSSGSCQQKCQGDSRYYCVQVHTQIVRHILILFWLMSIVTLKPGLRFRTWVRLRHIRPGHPMFLPFMQIMHGLSLSSYMQRKWAPWRMEGACRIGVFPPISFTLA
jgi:hypothetical protein